MSDQNEQLMFAVGNLTKTAIDTFVAAHHCNKYCELLSLYCFLRIQNIVYLHKIHLDFFYADL